MKKLKKLKISMNLKVVITDSNFSDVEIEKAIFNKIGAKVYLFQCRSEKEVIDGGDDADALLVQYAPITKHVIDSLNKCKVIGRYGTGVDNIDVNAATKKGIVVVNVPSYCEEEVADHTIALILALTRKIVKYNQAIKGGIWDWKIGIPIQRIKEQKLGLVGFGKNAKKVAQKARSLGFSVMGFDPYVTEEEFAKHRVIKVNFEQLLRESDIISIHAPLTAETKHMFGKEEFKKMKKSAYIINTSRGALINQEELYLALAQKEIAGAALDVMEYEPPLEDDALLKLDNVILTPHVAWYSERSLMDLRSKVATDVAKVLQGKVPYGFVNKKELEGKLNLKEHKKFKDK
jgi:D-3-phosphoglycerate dehydrogenase